MFLTVTLYEFEGEDRFAVKLVNPDTDTEPTDVTNHYELAAVQTDDGREGFTVLPKQASIADEAERNPNGTEL